MKSDLPLRTKVSVSDCIVNWNVFPVLFSEGVSAIAVVTSNAGKNTTTKNSIMIGWGDLYLFCIAK